MPLSKDSEKTLRNMERQYGKNKGRKIFYKTMNKYHLDDSKPLKDQKHKLRTALSVAYSNDYGFKAQMSDDIRAEIQCISFLGEVYNDSLVESQAARIKAQAEQQSKQLESETSVIAHQLGKVDRFTTGELDLDGVVTKLNKELFPNGVVYRNTISIRVKDGRDFTLPLPEAEMDKYQIGKPARIHVSITPAGQSFYLGDPKAKLDSVKRECD